MIKVSDYIISFLAEKGVRHIFILAGGQSMHLVDSIGRNPKVQHVSTLHEQAAAMMAEAYSRATDNFGVAVVTTGPGGTNTITGVASAWLDSTPCMFISGQFRVDNLIGDQQIRQTCLQGTNPVEIVRSITKYAVLVEDPKTIRYHLEKAFFLSRHNRPGPVWLDLPLDVQGAVIDEDALVSFDPNEEANILLPEIDETKILEVVQRLAKAKRPVIFAGNGIRLSHAIPEFLMFIEKLGVPVLTSINGIDLLPETHPLFMGRPNYWGQRYANLIIQNADVLLSIGAGMHLETTGFNYKAFAREAFKISVDADPHELKKRFFIPDLPVNCDAKHFMTKILQQADTFSNKTAGDWLMTCKKWKGDFPIQIPEYEQPEAFVHPFSFIDALSDEALENDVIIPGNAGTHFTTAVQAFRVKKGQRIFSEIGIGAMGHSLPSSIAASIALGKRRTICLTGDGGIQLNIQELQTVINYKLPIKIFVMSNGGYASIRNTQKGYFEGNLVGCTKESGMGLPSFRNIAEAYGFPFFTIVRNKELHKGIRDVLNSSTYAFCEVTLDADAVLKPKLVSKMMPDGKMESSPLEELWPFLERNEFESHMFIKPWK
jgi:acetolactate synthase-1/2/3 large subunit